MLTEHRDRAEGKNADPFVAATEPTSDFGIHHDGSQDACCHYEERRAVRLLQLSLCSKSQGACEISAYARPARLFWRRSFDGLKKVDAERLEAFSPTGV